MTETLSTIGKGSIHKEFVVEAHLVEQLVAEQRYLQREPNLYDRALALDKELVLRFVQSTQSEQWDKLVKQYAGQAESEFFKQVDKNLKSFGTLHLLRNGLKMIPNIEFRFCYFQPASHLNAALVARYEANILSAMRQVKYSLKNENAIDTVLFVNGFPIATLEFKNGLTGTSLRDAEAQYRKDRSPAGEPLLTFKRGALVHFALDEDLVSMTTRLQNGRTRFLPFNRGRDGGAGNPDVPGEFRIAYLYRDLPDGKAIFGRETLLAILSHFVHIEKEDNEERMIFPRYQQLDAVRKLLADAKARGAGKNYLIQHSAGSGKSNTIAWTAHQLIHLHDANEQPIFHTAIVVTDRKVLDKQLQDTVSQFEQTPGVVRKIDGTSKMLKQAIESGAKIIITTIQKFGTEHLSEVAGHAHRRFAIIVDEAHSSQSGKAADAMTGALTRTGEDVENAILETQRLRGPHANISYFAFTATPRHVTLERFGTKGDDGKPRPFHLYSMRQAIEEGFILDVLQNYMTYKAYYELEKAIESDPRYKSSRAQRKVAHFAHLHPTAVGQKVAVIVDHFRRHVMHELDGQAKGMIVTGSREAALKYWLSTNDYLAERGYDDLKALVAFSGELFVDGQVWTEAAANGIGELELPKKFNEIDEYRLLIVAEKYQTGFDQPKLCAMYVDRPLKGLQAVQTLSRLNRLAPGKHTFVLDFQNTMEEMKESFAPYHQITELEETSDPNQIFTLQTKLFAFGVLDRGEIDRFADIFYKPELLPYDRIILEGIIKNATARFAVIEEEPKREEFRQLLKSYLRFYTFVAQVTPLEDVDLEKLSSYGDWLLRLLPQREVPAEITITDEMLNLHAFKLEEKERGSIELGTSKLTGINEFAAKPYTVEEEKALSEIVQSFNQRYGTEFTEADLQRFDQVNTEIMNDDMIEMLRNNPADVVFKPFSDAFFKGLIKMFGREQELSNVVLHDQQARADATKFFFDRAFRQARAQS